MRFGVVASQLDRLLTHKLALAAFVKLLALLLLWDRFRLDHLNFEYFFQILFLPNQGGFDRIFSLFTLFLVLFIGNHDAL